MFQGTTAEVMKYLNILKGVRRVFFRILNTHRRPMWKKAFDRSYVGFMKDGARWMKDNTNIKQHDMQARTPGSSHPLRNKIQEEI
ncbi:hypothetical protein HanPI659440_Chr13g0509621 [Helianthus annuus]|nr:hypothetical protein HanPI659440_Chr13g0509621 [Helianthus annuus]